jgi:hypothetical protein
MRKTIPTMIKKTYLGDSVYASFDGWHVVLTTENDDRGPSNTIALEPEVLTALERFRQETLSPGPSVASDNPFVLKCAQAKTMSAAASRFVEKNIDAALLRIVPVMDSLSESCDFNPYGGSMWFTCNNREDVVHLLTLAPQWKKENVGTGIAYTATVEGVDYRITAIDDALPPTCRVVEKTVLVPEQVIAAHTEVQKVVECNVAEEVPAS